jgi:hypothetical protein
MSEDQKDSELLTLARKVNSIFVIPSGIERLMAPITSSETDLDQPYRKIATAFKTNISSIIHAAGLPYIFALEASHRRRYQSMECAAELEAVLKGYGGDNRGDQAATAGTAQAEAARRIRELGESPQGRDSLNHEACSVLLHSCESSDVRDAAAQLLLQATVLTWGAFEVVARDVFKMYINLRPHAYERLASDAEAKKRFELSRITMQRLADFGFDISAKLGELLAEQNDLADLGTIKVAVSSLFPNNVHLRAALDRRELWTLFQQRHLIVHRCAIVDQRYIDATGDARPLGDALVIRPQDLDRYTTAVVDVAAALLSAAATD